MDLDNNVSLSTAKLVRLPVFADALRSPAMDGTKGLGPVARGTEELSLSEKGDTQRDSASSDSIRALVDSANIELNRRHTSLSFRIDDSTDSLVVQIVDTATGDVLKQIPPDEILAMRERLQETIGLLLDTKG